MTTENVTATATASAADLKAQIAALQAQLKAQRNTGSSDTRGGCCALAVMAHADGNAVKVASLESEANQLYVKAGGHDNERESHFTMAHVLQGLAALGIVQRNQGSITVIGKVVPLQPEVKGKGK